MVTKGKNRLVVLVAVFCLIPACSASSGNDPDPNTKPNASFSFSPASPAVGQVVQFTDTSTGSPTSWLWNFGDGSTSTAQNPSHAYAGTGLKTVTLTVSNGTGASSMNRSLAVVTSTAIIINHTSTKLADIPATWIEQAKQTLHIAYGTASHGTQLYEGVTGLVAWEFGGAKYAYTNGGIGGTLDWRCYGGNFANLNMAMSLEMDYLSNGNRIIWEAATRTYLATNPGVNVIMWAWCYGADTSEANIQLYLDLMTGLERDYPQIKFVYMTGHTNGTGLAGRLHLRNNQIRNFCNANSKILYDFEDIESYNPDGDYFGDKLVDAACDYDSNGDGTRDRNWAIDWQNAHPGEWFNCVAAHTQPLNGNLKAYAAWHLFARLAGWDGN